MLDLQITLNLYSGIICLFDSRENVSGGHSKNLGINMKTVNAIHKLLKTKINGICNKRFAYLCHRVATRQCLSQSLH